jgi:hypothetical protein
MEKEMIRPMTEAEEKRYETGIPREKIVIERIWNKRPDGFTIKIPTTEKVGRTCHPGVQENVPCDRGIRHTDKERSGIPICVHKIGTRVNTWSPKDGR